ncbi:hypothetical protein Poli38472_007494 [Pythium oligandrum]|uniref:RRM domain-containing protein n=1 Tax=Pythium oligandrum TaxID=41045 RepID=A0A8K1CQ96_PYTOL|nr:hypothetical protein Poli38472_007494 [Pythium oligandrum]|eukprot:TMW67822.1 hypothetical protein Poli38472_007494 [Pythium oligandrum]
MELECKTLWMGDIQPHWDEAFIGSLFASCSEIPVVKLIRDKVTGYPSGYGFLEFQTQQGAQYVLENFNGQVIPNTMHRFRMNWGAGGRRLETGEDHSIFVGDLAPDVTDELLLSTFAARFASVRNAKVVTDPLTRMSKGFGFVRFGAKEEADQALQTMNGVYCSSRPMRVSVATDRNAGRPRQDFGMPGMVGVVDAEGANTTVFIGGLDANTTEEDLRARFAPFGEMVSVKVPPGRGCGFVHYITRDSAEMAINQMNGALINGSKIRCAWGRSAAVRAAAAVGGAAPATGYYQQYPQYGQAAGYQNYYGNYGGYYPQYQQAGYGGYGGYDAYGAAGQQQAPQQHAQQQTYGQHGHQGYYGGSHGHGHRRGHHQEPRDFTRPDDVDGMNRRYASQRAYQHMAPVSSASYTPMSADVSSGTAMASQ